MQEGGRAYKPKVKVMTLDFKHCYTDLMIWLFAAFPLHTSPQRSTFDAGRCNGWWNPDLSTDRCLSSSRVLIDTVTPRPPSLMGSRATHVIPSKMAAQPVLLHSQDSCININSAMGERIVFAQWIRRRITLSEVRYTRMRRRLDLM